MENSDHFEQAKQIAMTAATLDFDKNEFPDEARAIAAMCVNNLHTLAENLAGIQVGEIYSQSSVGDCDSSSVYPDSATLHQGYNIKMLVR